MEITYNYLRDKPVIHIRIEADNLFGARRLTDTIPIMVDTGSSFLVLPEKFLTEVFGQFVKSYTIIRTVEGMKRLPVINLNKGQIHFIDENEEFVYTTQIIPELKVLLMNGRDNILGRSVIGKHKYTFDGPNGKLIINF